MPQSEHSRQRDHVRCINVAWTFCGPRYGILACGELPDYFIEGRQATEIIMKHTKIDELEYRYGQDKVCPAATCPWLFSRSLLLLSPKRSPELAHSSLAPKSSTSCLPPALCFWACRLTRQGTTCKDCTAVTAGLGSVLAPDVG